MMAGRAQPLAVAPATDRHRRRVAELVAGASIEIWPRDDLAGDKLRGLFPAGTTVFVNHPGSVTHHDIVAACARLRRAGFDPVPHVAARRIASLTQARDFLRRAAGEAAVETMLLIGGDADPPVGPFADALSLLASGVVEHYGLRRIAFAGYPEGHPQISARALDSALRSKLALAQRLGLAPMLISQFGFEAGPIRRWIAGLRAQGILCPIRVGIAGPASVATLAKFAVRCGISASLRALSRGQTAFARILTEANPDALVEALAASEAAAAPIEGLHLFTFGGVRRAAEWVRAHR
jgi:methylenetetrahydrofolate reductase (NADPH)